MDWRILLIPLIPLAIWIVVTIFRSMESKKDEEELPTRRPRREAEGSAASQRRQPASELDRFLQQAKQRRSGSRAHREAAPALQPPPEPRVEELPRARPAPPPVAPAPPAIVVAATLAPTPVAEPQFEPVASRPIAPMPFPRPVAPPVLAKLRALLADRDSLKAAIALQEILTRPVGQRR